MGTAILFIILHYKYEYYRMVMGKFSFFDFVSFVLPGGTLIVLTYLFWIPEIQTILKLNPEGSDSFLFIPFLVLSYSFGHVLSYQSKKLENFYWKKKAWTYFLKENLSEAEKIDQLSMKQFECCSFFDDKGDVIDSKSGVVFDKIFDYLDFVDKNEKIKIIMGQYAFFRNLLSVWVWLILINGGKIILGMIKGTGVMSYNLNIIYCVLMGALFLISYHIMIGRKKLFMGITYRTYIMSCLTNK